MDLQVEQEMSHATHNRVLLGHRGVKFHLVQLLVVEEYDELYQHVYIREVQLFYAMVKCLSEYSIVDDFFIGMRLKIFKHSVTVQYFPFHKFVEKQIQLRIGLNSVFTCRAGHRKFFEVRNSATRFQIS